jgi:hypothetical protein
MSSVSQSAHLMHQNHTRCLLTPNTYAFRSDWILLQCLLHTIIRTRFPPLNRQMIFKLEEDIHRLREASSSSSPSNSSATSDCGSNNGHGNEDRDRERMAYRTTSTANCI